MGLNGIKKVSICHLIIITVNLRIYEMVPQKNMVPCRKYIVDVRKGVKGACQSIMEKELEVFRVIYCIDEKIRIRSMELNEPQITSYPYTFLGKQSIINNYFNYCRVQEKGKTYIFSAEYDGKIVGYSKLKTQSTTGPFAGKSIPEIVDFTVFLEYQGRGFGNKILDVTEQAASKISNTISICIGLHQGYGAAQRIYARRGYIPDGSGVWFMGTPLEKYKNCCNNNELVIYLSKELQE